MESSKRKRDEGEHTPAFGKHTSRTNVAAGVAAGKDVPTIVNDPQQRLIDACGPHWRQGRRASPCASRKFDILWDVEKILSGGLCKCCLDAAQKRLHRLYLRTLREMKQQTKETKAAVAAGHEEPETAGSQAGQMLRAITQGAVLDEVGMGLAVI